jgi:hypothetical protein
MPFRFKNDRNDATHTLLYELMSDVTCLEFPYNCLEFPGDYPESPGNHPEFPGNHPEFSGNHPEFPGNHPEFPGNHPEFAGNHPEFVGSYPEFAGNYPEFAGNGENTAFCRAFLCVLCLCVSKMKEESLRTLDSTPSEGERIPPGLTDWQIGESVYICTAKKR